MGKLKVETKGHTRRAYLRKDGTRVKSTEVSPSTRNIKDRGLPGRTPKGKQWFEPQVETGWRKSQSEAVRRVGVLKAHKGDELTSGRAMQALANVTTDKETKRKAKSDAQYFFRIHREMPRRRVFRRRALRITPKQPKLRR